MKNPPYAGRCRSAPEGELIVVYTGPEAFGRAASFNADGGFATLVIDSSETYRWPVGGKDVLIVFDPAWNQAAECRLAVELIEAGAAMVISATPDVEHCNVCGETHNDLWRMQHYER